MNENKENNNNNIKIKNFENDVNNDINNNNCGTNLVKKIKYIPYNKINMKKFNSESIIRNKKNEYKKLLSSESINEKNSNINTNNFINSGNKDIKFNDNNNNNSSSKNIFFTKIKLSNINLRDNRDKKKFISDKFSSLSNRQSNSNDNIFTKKLYSSNLSLKEKITKEKNNKENGFLPELNAKNRKNRIINKNSLNEKNNSKKLSTFKSKTIFEDKMKYFKSKSISTDKINLNNNNEDMNMNINLNKNSKNVLINCSPSTSAYTNSTKKINTNKTNNLTDDLSKFRIGLLSAGTSSYNNVIIPMLSLRRPVSNFNFGGDKLWNNIGDVNINNMNILDKGNEIKEKNVKNENNLNEKEESVVFKNNINNLNGIFNNNNILYKNQKYNGKYDSENPNELMLKNMEKLIPKFHKIKIEKGMMNSKIAKNISKKLFINYYNQRNKISRRFNSYKDRNSNNFII